MEGLWEASLIEGQYGFMRKPHSPTRGGNNSEGDHIYWFSNSALHGRSARWLIARFLPDADRSTDDLQYLVAEYVSSVVTSLTAPNRRLAPLCRGDVKVRVEMRGDNNLDIIFISLQP